MQHAILNGADTAFVDQGEGPVLLFVHGFPLNHTMWQAQIDEFQSDHRVLAPDLRGFGQSGPLEQGVDVVTMDQFADDLAALLDDRGVTEPIVLCGLSMGGYIALAFLRRHAARLRGLILCDTRATADTPEVFAARQQTVQRVLAEGPGVVAEAMLPRLFSPTTAQHRPELIERVRQMMLNTDRRTVAAAALGMGQRADSTPALAAATCPALILVGRDDALSPPAEMHEMAEALSDVRFLEISDAGHLAPLENPESVNRAIRSFLTRATKTATGS